MSEDVRRAERELYDAMVAKDFAALRRILAPDLVYVHSTAVAESRDEYLAGVDNGLYEYARVESRDVRVRTEGTIALLDGVCEMVVGARGQSKDLIHLLFLLVWRREAEGWRLVHRHATRMPMKPT